MWTDNAPFLGLGAMLAVALLGWVISLIKRNVGIVDSLWAVFFVTGALVYFVVADAMSSRGVLVLALVLIWAARLSGYITWRNWGKPEDHRYQAIRRRNEPGFTYKSLYLVFILQALLAWIISAPLLAAMHPADGWAWSDIVGTSLVVIGIAFESIGDAQLARFKADPHNAGCVMDRGLWRYTRHPNYFGEFCIWWGFYALALAAGGAWTIFAPVLMTVLLLKVSGVALLEKDIAERRPEYRDYVRRTNAFLPGLPKSRNADDTRGEVHS